LSGTVLDRLNGFRPTDDLSTFFFHPQMMGQANAFRVAMGKGSGLAGCDHPVDRPSGSASALRVELSEELHQRHPPPAFRNETSLPGKRRAEFHSGRAGLPAPGLPNLRNLRRPSGRSCRSANPLRMAMGELNGLNELLIAEGAYKEMGRALT
jgi:hypothetical protein